MVQERLEVFTKSCPHHIELYWNDEKNAPRSYSMAVSTVVLFSFIENYYCECDLFFDVDR